MSSTDSVNLHVERLSEVPAAIDKIRMLTGEEPVVCVHIYGASFEAVREFFQQRGKFRTVSPGASTSGFRGEMTVDDFRNPKHPPESPELIEAREKLAKWMTHATTNYAIEQRGHWRRRVELLSAAQDGAAPPPDETHDDA